MKFSFFHLMPYTHLELEPHEWPFPNRYFDATKASTLYRTYVESMIHAESCGFDWVGCNEHHFSPYGMMANPNLIGGALAYSTHRSKIAITGNLVPLNNPIRVAEEYAMLDCMTGGRLVAGLMRGIPHEYLAYNIPPGESWERQREAVQLILKAWTEPEPFGWEGKHFFQKDSPQHRPPWVETVRFPATTREGETRLIDYALVQDDLTLLWMVNMGCIDMHAWSSRADRPERPDWVLFDLDPSEGVGFTEAVEVALLVRDALALAGLEGFPKTSGSRGIHVLVPISRRHTFAQTHEFAAVIASALARAHPGLVTTEWTKTKRRGVLVDANQNGPGKTTASVYSVRPRAGAPVSTPLRWEELTPALDPAAFTMDAVLDRVARHGDLFASVLGLPQSLGRALRELGA